MAHQVISGMIVRCSVLQLVEACCSVLQCQVFVRVSSSNLGYGSVLQCVAACCSVLQCVAVCCSVENLSARLINYLYCESQVDLGLDKED